MIPTINQNTKQHVNPAGKKVVSIAMQGGGAHGAFSWGVLDRLLEDGRILIEGVTGTSAGGMNAVATIQGLIDGGNEGARKLLHHYWKTMCDKSKASGIHRGVIDRWLGKYTMYNSPEFLMFDFMSKLMSPYQTNPFNINPLKEIVEEVFDFEKIQKSEQYKIFLAATHVYTGKIKVFGNKEIDSDSLMATACLPTVFHAAMVKGEYYWDGGFIANPVMYPLIYNCATPDIIILKLNPTHRKTLPTSAIAISDRLNEITNNASLLKEMRAIKFISDLIDKKDLDPNKYKRVFIHNIENEETFQDLGWSSKLNSEWDFVQHLFEEGRKTADKWLAKNYEFINKKTTIDEVEMFC